MRKTLFVCAAAMLFAASVRASDAEARLREAQRRMDGVSSISGTFTQRKKLEFLNDPVVSSGRFFFAKPDSLVWEYVSPAPSGLRVEKGKASVWDGPPGARVIQRGAMSRAAKMVADQVMLWMNFKPRDILASYDVKITADRPLTFAVTPKREGLRRFLKSITVILGDDLRVMQSVSLEENDAVTTIVFEAVEFDAPPPPGLRE